MYADVSTEMKRLPLFKVSEKRHLIARNEVFVSYTSSALYQCIYCGINVPVSLRDNQKKPRVNLLLNSMDKLSHGGVTVYFLLIKFLMFTQLNR